MSQFDVIVFGGYGTFGQHIVRELAASGLQVTVAGRHRQQAERAAAALGNDHRGISADVSDLDACRSAIAGHCVAINAAGPFATFESTLLDACLDTGCHYVDIADDRGYVARVRGRSSDFKAAELSAAYGCSSLPGISGALASVLCEPRQDTTDHVRVTLFIGNRNPKGLGAVRSAAAGVGRLISAPQGELLGFGGSECVPLFPPFGRRRTLNFSSPDYDLLPEMLRVQSVSVKVGFELPGVTAGFGILARGFPGLGRWLIPRLVPFTGLLGWIGSSGGQVMVELFAGGALACRAAMIAVADGQRLAALPAVYVARQLCRGKPSAAGAVTAYDLLGPRNLIDMLEADGFEFRCDPAMPLVEANHHGG